MEQEKVTKLIFPFYTFREGCLISDFRVPLLKEIKEYCAEKRYRGGERLLLLSQV